MLICIPSCNRFLQAASSTASQGSAAVSVQGGTTTESPGHSTRHGSQVIEPSLDPCCLEWLQNELQLLCPDEANELRGSAEDPRAFVGDLFSSSKHSPIFEDFLKRTDGLPLFVALQPSRCFSMATVVPRPGTYESFMYFLKPPCSENPAWTRENLTQMIQV